MKQADNPKKPKKLIGRAEKVDLPELGYEDIPVRVDTGANTSSLWASVDTIDAQGLHFRLFDESSPLYTGQVHTAHHFEETVVASSIGEPQRRYKIKLLVKLKGKRIRAQVTLADRSKQVYPMLLGRNVLRGKFIVDVQNGKALYNEERQRSEFLQAKLTAKE